MRLIGFIALMLLLATTKNALAQKKPVEYVGEIIIVGNTVTQDHVIRKQLSLYPGQVLDRTEMNAVETRLAKLGLFKVNPALKVYPTVMVVNSAGPFKDILVTVEEDSNAKVKLERRCDRIGQPIVCLVLEDRNFDLFRFPTSLADFHEGKAFRGAGQNVRLELLRLNVFELRISILPGGQILPLAVRSLLE